MLTRDWTAPWPLDLRRVLRPVRRGPNDPAFRIDRDGTFWRACRTPEGPGTLRLRQRGSVVHAAAWGEGAGWLLEGLPELLGAGDVPEEFVARHPAVAEAVRRSAGLRLARTGLVFEALVPSILEQKVLLEEAWRAWGYLLRRFGEPAPGPAESTRGLRVPPPPRVWALIPSWEWHRSGAEPVRARTIVGAARMADRLEADPSMERLTSLPGIGVWTAAEARQRALGDADAVSVGDYHLPRIVGRALCGRPVDDAGMLELLAPYAGHRHRVIRLLEVHGARAERRAPRLPVRDYRRF
ncbi:DNA-3-methyladenine glycosylase [Actinomadura kijaniata]